MEIVFLDIFGFTFASDLQICTPIDAQRTCSIQFQTLKSLEIDIVDVNELGAHENQPTSKIRKASGIAPGAS